VWKTSIMKGSKISDGHGGSFSWFCSVFSDHKKMNDCFFFVIFFNISFLYANPSLMCAILLFCTAKSQEAKKSGNLIIIVTLHLYALKKIIPLEEGIIDFLSYLRKLQIRGTNLWPFFLYYCTWNVQCNKMYLVIIYLSISGSDDVHLYMARNNF